MKSIIMLFCFVFGFIGYSQATEKEVLVSFEKIKSAIEIGVNYQTYTDYVVKINTEINMHKREKKHNSKFIAKAEECLGFYKTAQDAWNLKVDPDMPDNMDSILENIIQTSWNKGSDCVDNLYK